MRFPSALCGRSYICQSGCRPAAPGIPQSHVSPPRLRTQRNQRRPLFSAASRDPLICTNVPRRGAPATTLAPVSAPGPVAARVNIFSQPIEPFEMTAPDTYLPVMQLCSPINYELARSSSVKSPFDNMNTRRPRGRIPPLRYHASEQCMFAYSLVSYQIVCFEQTVFAGGPPRRRLLHSPPPPSGHAATFTLEHPRSDKQTRQTPVRTIALTKTNDACSSGTLSETPCTVI